MFVLMGHPRGEWSQNHQFPVGDPIHIFLDRRVRMEYGQLFVDVMYIFIISCWLPVFIVKYLHFL